MITDQDAVNILEGLDDPDVCRGIAVSLRTYMGMIPEGQDNRHTENIRKIAFAEDSGTKAMIEVQRID